MNGARIVFQKELARFFGDRRLALTTILLPAVMIYVVYSFMGSALQSQFTVGEDHTYTIEITQPSPAITTAAEQAGLTLIETDDPDGAQERLREQELDLLIVLPEGFDEAVAAYDLSTGASAPQAALYYNSASTSSQAAFYQMSAVFDAYERTLSNRFDLNGGEGPYDLVTSRDATGSIFSAMLPMLLIIFLFSGCMAVAPESIAGEKERGTIATLLVTPVRRSELAIGKIAALSVIALLAGASSTLGTLLSLPKLMSASEETLSGAVYGAQDYLLLALVILSTVLLLIALISLVSAFARTVKEAQGYVTPIMIVAMMVGVTSMFGSDAAASPLAYCIPLYNSVQSMSAVLSFEAVPLHILLTVASNLLLTGAGVYLLTRMFNSERVMFSR